MPFGIVAYAFMLFSWTTFLETAVYHNVINVSSMWYILRFEHAHAHVLKLI